MIAYDIMDRECAVIATETYSYDAAHDPAPSVPVGTMSFDDPVPAGTMSNEDSEHTDIMSYDIPVHNRYYNNNGQPIGKSDGQLPKGYTNIATK